MQFPKRDNENALSQSRRRVIRNEGMHIQDD